MWHESKNKNVLHVTLLTCVILSKSYDAVKQHCVKKRPKSKVSML